MNDRERQRRIAAVLKEERDRDQLGLWWLSFADGSKPKGSTFLGVVIVEAYGFTDAIQKSHDLGINPGGEVQGFLVPSDGHPVALHNRLLQRDELEDIGVSTLESKDKVNSVCGTCNKEPQ